MTCEEAVKKLQEYIDKELDRASSEQLDKHLELCRICCDHMEFEKSMKKLVHESCFEARAPEFLKQKIMNDLGVQE